MDISVRKARLEELEVIRELYTHLFFADDPPPSKVRLEEIWQEIESHPSLSCLVITVNARVVGTCCLTIVPNIPRGSRPYALIEHVVIHSEHRGKGLGRKLIEDALATAWGSNCYKVMLLSGSDNKESHIFYEKLGFDRNRKIGFEISKR